MGAIANSTQATAERASGQADPAQPARPAEPAELDGWRHCAALREPLERRLADALADLSAPLGGPLNRIVSAGGKRLRAGLTLTVARLLTGTNGPAVAVGQPASDRHHAALDLATAVELLHAATLVHDDLIDGAPVRRGVPTVHAAEGEPAAVIGGDALIAAASMLATGVSQRAGRLLAETLLELCRGEALEGSLRYDPTAGPEQLLEVVALKTGSLVRTACMLGAEAVGAAPSICEAIGRYGMEFGMVLQLVDDLLDIVSSPALAGKPVGADFRAGVPTLPAAFAMQLRPELRDMFGADRRAEHEQRHGAADPPAALALLRCPDAIRAVLEVASAHADRAARALACVPAVVELADWPSRYLRDQLNRRVHPDLAYLLRPAELAS